MKLLHLDSSILGDQSVSRHLGRELVEAIRLAEAQVDLRYRDLAAEPPPAFDATLLAARALPAEARSAAQRELVARADAVLAEFVDADLLVIGAPMYNFGIPSQLKSWIDLVSVAGVTFRYGANGPEGLMKGKRALIVATSGGQHAGKPGLGHVDYLQSLLNFLGVEDVRVITAEGLAMGPGVREPALAAARERIAEEAAAA